MIVLGKPEKVLDTKGVNHMENEMLDQMHKKLVWKITIQFIWILCITAMIICIIYEGIMQVHRSHVWALGGMALILLITYFIWNLHTLWELFENKTKVENELERSSTLIHCVTELSANQDVDEAINHLLEIINQYFKSDRTYIFEIDEERQIVHNSYEYAAKGVSKEIENLNEVPIQIIASWIKKFEREGSFYISNLDLEKDREDERAYECLKAQNVNSLLAVPLIRNREIIGFIGVDNPRKNYRDFPFLSSIQFFIMNRLDTKAQQEKLQYLSYRDALTNLYNRNRYMSVLENYGQNKGQLIRNVGVVYMDLNELKKVNDEQGHEAGDSYIRRAAQQIVAVFPEHTYRIGGDEFVVLYPEIEQAEFEYFVSQLQKNAKEHQVNISYGVVWKEMCENLKDLLTEADKKMYEDKKLYYSNTKHNRRGQIERNSPLCTAEKKAM